jgi:hypothetical protein
MVLLGRIELPTSSLPMTRSTTELQQHTPKVRPYAKGWGCCQAACAFAGYLASGARACGMEWRTQLAKDAQDKERIKAERLREALRANLRRRKAKPQSQGSDAQKE